MTRDVSPSHAFATRPRGGRGLQSIAAVAALGLITGAPGIAQSAGESTSAKGDDPHRVVEAHQDSGKITYWVLPGPRVLEEEVFGTPDNPTATLKPKLQAARQSKGPPAVVDTLKKVPFMVGVPEKARSVTDDGTYILKHPTPFSNKARIISGQFEATYTDVVREDPPGKPGNTPDTATFEAQFTDPAGNDYRVTLDHVVKPPFPGYKTQGGVMTDSVHHGTTGTGSPLMPKVETHAAFWGLGELYINGEKVDDQRVMHLMTTEVVRDKDYNLVHSNDLPLGPEERHVRGQEHHTHLMMPPIRGVPGKGPVFDPVPTTFELPNGKKQPFLHIMFEEDTVSSRQPADA